MSPGRTKILLVETGDEATVHGFSLISSFEYNHKGSKHAQRLRYLEITQWSRS